MSETIQEVMEPVVDIVIPTVEKKAGRPKKVKEVTPVKEVKEEKVAPKKEPTFLQVEQVGSGVDPLALYNSNPNYIYRWCQKTKMANNRKGIWRTVPKDHPDFIGMRVNIDHSEDQNFYSFGDLVLCCSRRETVEAKRKDMYQRNLKRGEVFEQSAQNKLNKLARDTKDGITQAMVDSLDE